MAAGGKSMTLRTKLLLMVILMNGLLLVAGSFMIARLFQTASGYERFRQHAVQLANANGVLEDLTHLNAGLNTFLRTEGSSTALSGLRSQLNSLQVRIDLYRQNHGEGSADLIGELQQQLDALRSELGASVERERLLTFSEQKLPALAKRISAHVQADISTMDAAQAAITRGDLRALQYGLIGIGLALMAGLGISYVIFDIVIRPLGDTHRALLQVLSGNFRGLSLPRSDDEIGAIGRVIDDIKARSEHVYRLAYSDSLTALPNRLQLARDLGDMARHAGERRSYGLLLIAVNRFSELNSSFGPRFGDEVIQETRSRLENLIDRSDRLYRYTGHMFACLMRPTGNDDDAQRQAAALAEKIRSDFNTPLRIGELNLPLSLSIGVALSLQKVRPDNILAEAEAALVEAKRRGGAGIVVGLRDYSERTRRRLEMASAIRRGIEASEFEPYFQPIVDIARGITVGAETLVRWRHADGRLTMPGEFILVAEESDLITGITTLVVEKSCRHLARWKAAGHAPRISFNVSARLMHVGLHQILDDALRNNQVPANDLEMEITETALIANQHEAEQLILQLKDKGLRIVLDDFGTGYSSLGYLSRFAIDKIKIDSNFVKSLADGERQRQVVAAMIDLARRLDIDVVAEGVETVEQMQMLRDMGCDLMQGWLFSAAVPADEFTRWLEAPGAMLEKLRG